MSDCKTCGKGKPARRGLCWTCYGRARHGREVKQYDKARIAAFVLSTLPQLSDDELKKLRRAIDLRLKAAAVEKSLRELESEAW